MRSIKLFISCAALCWAGLACGGSDLDRPQSLAVTSFAANTAFRLSFTMTSCSDRCAVYASADCTASVKAEEMVIEANPRATVVDQIDSELCVQDNQCGFPVAAFCDVEGLAAGTWTVRAGDFTGNIIIQ